MKTRLFPALFFLAQLTLRAQSESAPPATTDETVDEGSLSIEGAIGYNTYPTSQYVKAPLFFTAGSHGREISTRVLLLSDISHASNYFAGDSAWLNEGGIYLYNFGMIDIDYLSWHGKMWSAGFGGGLAHQGFLISGAGKSAHAVVGRVRGQFYLYWTDFLATQLVSTLPFAFYQSATDQFRLWHNELNFLFDFKGKVRFPEAQSFMFSVSLHYDYIHLNHALRTYSQHEFTPLFKAMVLY